MSNTHEEILYQRSLPNPPARPILTALGCIAVLSLIMILLVILCWMPALAEDPAAEVVKPWGIVEWASLTGGIFAGICGLLVWGMFIAGRKKP